MKVSDEWRGHAHDLRRIAEMVDRRPTYDCEDHIEKLTELAEEFEKQAADYAATEENG